MRFFPLIPLVALAATAPAQHYQVHTIDAGGTISDIFWPERLGSEGVVAGSVGEQGNSGRVPAIWSVAQGTTLLATLPGLPYGHAKDINGAGLIVGYLESGAIGSRIAVAWINGTPTPIADLVTPGTSLDLRVGMRVNERGWMVGTYLDQFFGIHRAWILKDGELTRIFGNGVYGSSATGLTEDGTVCGDYNSGAGHAYVWRDGVTLDLHQDPQIQGLFSYAFDINESGVVVGAAEYAAPPPWNNATRWDAGVATHLDPTHPERTSYLNGINAHGIAVGGRSNPSEAIVSFAGGAVGPLQYYLTGLSGWQLTSATDIDDQGRILGMGITNGLLSGYLLEPVCVTCDRHCTVSINSTGGSAVLSTGGWESVAHDYFELRTWPAPIGEVGMFIGGATGIQVPFGDGFLCVGGGVTRLAVATVDPARMLRADLSLSGFTPGDTWHFQSVFRDNAMPGGTGWNTSDSLEVTFLP